MKPDKPRCSWSFDFEYTLQMSFVSPLSISTVIGACPHDCPDTCSFVTEVQGGVALKVRGNPAHAHTGGALCAKVSKYTERTYHPERLLYPLKRVGAMGAKGAKGVGQYERVSWDEALDDIARRLKAIAARDPQAIQPYSYAGTMGMAQSEGMAARFFNKLGAAFLDRTICASAGTAGLVHTLGGKVGMKVEFFAQSKLIIIWGSNSIASNLHFWRHVQEAKRLGARVWCIDPRRSETAEKCHAHIQLLPGTDAALALAIMHELIVHDWLDHDYIAQHTLGWEKLKARALGWNPERAAQVCGVPVAHIIDLAREYGEAAKRGEPVAIRLN
jgi:anaerobic selenocysteine-containing dehydrogenase